MNYENFVEARTANTVAIDANSIVLQAATAPNRLPPEGGGFVVLADSLGKPSFVEIISYSMRSGQTLAGVVRGLEGTVAREWPAGSFCFQTLTAGEYAKIVAAVRTPTESTLTYTDGLLTSIASVQAEGVKTTTLNYVEGVLTSMVTTLNNWTKTDTLIYTDGVLTSTTTSEVYS